MNENKTTTIKNRLLEELNQEFIDYCNTGVIIDDLFDNEFEVISNLKSLISNVIKKEKFDLKKLEIIFGTFVVLINVYDLLIDLLSRQKQLDDELVVDCFESLLRST
ncbi:MULTISPECIES: hypothetical protein [Vagococcus]|uniref:Uncharacterized protein n=1 Tax=Vagococcus fluvialis bH819 TaxID=1255619 RepID=A0A1X6WS29_9ENTE|nr:MULTISPECIES: hypothetical protein [Vagococcus]SLM87100.1 hypothetical protein FM121_13460 [Vagococcus fluvialis bH819]HCM90620.1 hypothetical protein [Vagococcus sp.]